MMLWWGTSPVINPTKTSLDPAPRGAIELPAYYKSHKDQKFLCKAHGNEGCKSCCKSIHTWAEWLLIIKSDGRNRYVDSFRHAFKLPFRFSSLPAALSLDHCSWRFWSPNCTRKAKRHPRARRIMGPTSRSPPFFTSREVLFLSDETVWVVVVVSQWNESSWQSCK